MRLDIYIYWVFNIEHLNFKAHFAALSSDSIEIM